MQDYRTLSREKRGERATTRETTCQTNLAKFLSLDLVVTGQKKASMGLW